MKLGILGDLHLRASKPINRVDNYNEKQFEKLAQAFDTFNDKNCTAVLQPGDLLNNYGRDPYSIVYQTLAFLMLHKLSIYLVFGQHDIRFHNTELTDIPIQILNQTELVNKLESNPTNIGINDDVLLYGANWQEKIPRVRKEKNITKILVMHSMVIKRKKLWPGQTDFIRASNLRNNNFDLIVTGDNHQAFIQDKVINCGSLMRMNIDQQNHQPIFGIYDTKTNDLEVFEYDLDDSKTVFPVQEKIQQDISKENKEKFRESLNSEFKGELDFRENILKTIKKQKKKVRQRSKDIIEESLNQGVE